MADFRRWFTVLAVLALTAGLASAQIGTNTGTLGGALSCNASSGGTPVLRPEGYTELIGDILIQCTGGPLITPSANELPLSTANITIYVSPAVNVTSRRLGSSGNLSESLLLIDDPGAVGDGAPAGAGWGPLAAQSLCTTVSAGCPAYASLSSNGTLVAASAYGSGSPAANVYQGVLNDLGPQTVTFYNVPVLPPATIGIIRQFRITNVRIPAVGLSGTISVFVSTSPSAVLPLQNAVVQVGTIGPPMTASVTLSSNNPFAQCKSTSSPALAATVDFKEGFGTAFKTRVVPLTSAALAAEGTNTTGPYQNIPGGTYANFSQNSESGLIFPGLTGTSGGVTYTAGLADFGTRLKAVFTNIPAGITLYVSNTATNTAPANAGDNTLTPYAILVAANQSAEATIDPAAKLTTGGSTGSDGFYAYPLTPNASNVAYAIWEVTNSDLAIDTYSFSVYVAYTAVAPTTTYPYGLPQATGAPGVLPNNVSMSFAPEPGGGTFTAAAASSAGTNPIPRFAILNSYNGAFVSIVLCQTTLLYPYVTNLPGGGLGQGFDTGIVVANTSSDPFTALAIAANFKPGDGKTNVTFQQTGSCTLYPYGNTYSASGVVSGPAPNPVKGCDQITNGVPGTNCFPVVATGNVGSVLASSVLPNFQGYVIAVCNFQYAHGYAAVTDLGLRGLFSSYLALELQWNRREPRGVSIETLVH